MLNNPKLYSFNLFIAIFLIFFHFYSFSQEKKIIQIQGLITNTQNDILSYAFIYDKLAQKGYLANNKGEFNIFVERGTDLTFTHIGYKKASYTIPLIGNSDILFLRIKLNPDTILLKELTIFPWKTYQQFIQAFINIKIPDDDISRAYLNIAIMKSQLASMEDDDYFQSASVAYKINQQRMANDLYWKGQTQPMQIFNIMAWQEFIRYIREGKFKNPNKRKNN
ncbi:MAG: carboxypeptidase-like regulatory domain-containing protein [Bacteroidales bacterium]